METSMDMVERSVKEETFTQDILLMGKNKAEAKSKISMGKSL